MATETTKLNYQDIGKQAKTLADYRADANEAFEKAETILKSLTFNKREMLKRLLGLDIVTSDEQMGQYEPKPVAEISAIFKKSSQTVRKFLNEAVETLQERGTFKELNRLVHNYINAHRNATALIQTDISFDELENLDTTTSLT